MRISSGAFRIAIYIDLLTRTLTDVLGNNPHSNNGELLAELQSFCEVIVKIARSSPANGTDG